MAAVVEKYAIVLGLDMQPGEDNDLTMVMIDDRKSVQDRFDQELLSGEYENIFMCKVIQEAHRAYNISDEIEA